MAIQLFHTVLVVALLITAVTSITPRIRRRAPVTNIQEITLQELAYSCSVQAWPACLDMVTSLLDSNHAINQFIENCLHRNNPYEATPSLPTSSSAIYTNIEDRADNTDVESGSGDSPNPSPVPSPSPSPSPISEPTVGNSSRSDGTAQRCMVTGEQKRHIRNEVYCRQLFDMDEMLRSLIPLMCWLRDLGCVSYIPDPGYLTPNQIMESIKLWHEDMISTHKKCCESQDGEEDEQDSNRIFTRDLDTLYSNRVIWIGDAQNVCYISGAVRLWDSGLSRVGVLVHMLELMQRLGRRRTCLRGCVNEDQVVCTNLLPYML